MREKINRFIRKITATERRPRIRWKDIVRLEAIGTDALGPFEVSVTFIYEEGTQTTVAPHHKGYDQILGALPKRIRQIHPDWLDQMRAQPWHVESVLYSRDAADANPCAP